jgi:DNA-binding GntR family transcriptional regulator
MVYHFGMESGREPEGDKKRIKGADVHALIRQAITSGRFSPGQRLSERELAVQYDVSRTPIREAFRHLIQEGLVVYKPNSGYRIIPLSEELARHILMVRETLESMAARLAALRDPKGTAEAMARTLPRARRAYREGHMSGLITANQSFHQALVERSGNPVLEAMYRTLQGYIGLMMSISLSWHRRPVVTFREHEEILRALKRGDPDAAERAIRRHVRSAYAGVLKNVRQYLTQAVRG